MRKKCVLALLAAAVMLCGMYMPAGASAEDIYFFAEDDTLYWEDAPDPWQDGQLDAETNAYGGRVYSQTGGRAAPTQTPNARALPEKNASSAKTSDFVINGDALVKYQGRSSSVAVPEGVRVICSGAFAGNSALISVSLPDSVAEIQDGAFENCVNLQTIRTGGNSRLTTVGQNAFKGCPKLSGRFGQQAKNNSVQTAERRTAIPSSTARPVSGAPNAQRQPGQTSGTAYGRANDSAVKNTGSGFGAARPTTQPTSGRTSPAPQAPVQNQAVSSSGSLKITRQPASVHAQIGDAVSFIVVAEGGGSIQYQWMQQSASGGEWSKIENSSAAFQNASTNVLSFTVTSARANRRFKCVITDGVHTIESKTVSVLLGQQGDLNGFGPSARYEATSRPTSVPSWGKPGRANGAAVRPEPTAGETLSPEYFGMKSPSSSAAESSLSAPAVSAWQVSGGSAKVIWTSVKRAAGYELYRSVNGGEFTLLASLGETSYLDTGLDFAANTYRYSVRARLSSAGTSGRGLSASSNVAEALALSEPSAVFAWRESEDTAKITWSPVDNASSYELYRWVNGENETLVQQTKELSYLDTGLDFSRNQYTYRAVAVLSVPEADVYIKSGFSAPAHIEAEDTSPKETELDGVVYTATPDGAVVTAYRGKAESLTIPSVIDIQNKSYTVIGIGPAVFKDNKTLKKITLPDTIQAIETAAFAYCGAMIDQ